LGSERRKGRQSKIRSRRRRRRKKKEKKKNNNIINDNKEKSERIVFCRHCDYIRYSCAHGSGEERRGRDARDLPICKKRQQSPIFGWQPK